MDGDLYRVHLPRNSTIEQEKLIIFDEFEGLGDPIIFGLPTIDAYGGVEVTRDAVWIADLYIIRVAPTRTDGTVSALSPLMHRMGRMPAPRIQVCSVPLSSLAPERVRALPRVSRVVVGVYVPAPIATVSPGSAISMAVWIDTWSQLPSGQTGIVSAWIPVIAPWAIKPANHRIFISVLLEKPASA